MFEICWEIFAKEIKRIKRLNKFANVLATAGLPLVIGVLVTFHEPIIKIDFLLFWVPLSVFALAQIALICAALTDTPILPEMILELRSIEERKRRLEGQLEKLSGALLGAQTHVEAVYQWMGMENLYTGAEQKQGFDEVISEILSIVVESRSTFFGFSDSELWNFAVYIHNSGQNILNPVWRECHERLKPPEGFGRSWPASEGHVGLAFTQKVPQITSDATVAEIADIVKGRAERHRESDLRNYRSFASLPLMLEDGNEPIGVLVATSDQIGRFDKANTKILRDAARILAKIYKTLEK